MSLLVIVLYPYGLSVTEIYEIEVYVTPDTSIPLMIGNPAIEDYPNLLEKNYQGIKDMEESVGLNFIVMGNLIQKPDKKGEFWINQFNETNRIIEDNFQLLP